MDYNDGSSFGYDQIAPFDQIPIQFELGTLDSDPPRTVLVAPQEYPRPSVVRPLAQTDPVTEKRLVKKIVEPWKVQEGFSGIVKQFSQTDLNLFLLFLLIIVVVLQVKNTMQLDMLMRLQFINQNPPRLG